LRGEKDRRNAQQEDLCLEGVGARKKGEEGKRKQRGKNQGYLEYDKQEIEREQRNLSGSPGGPPLRRTGKKESD